MCFGGVLQRLGFSRCEMDVWLKILTLNTDAEQVKVGGRRIVCDVQGALERVSAKTRDDPLR